MGETAILYFTQCLNWYQQSSDQTMPCQSVIFGTRIKCTFTLNMEDVFYLLFLGD